MRTVHVDGGAFVEPPEYRFHDAYFSVCEPNGELIHFEKNIGDLWSGLAEYEAIKWAVLNIAERPLTICSDCTTAIAWARHGSSKKSKFRVSRLDLIGISLLFLHDNAADRYNSSFHSPKHDKEYYVRRYYETKGRCGKN